jgi:hypothetical protein
VAGSKRQIDGWRYCADPSSPSHLDPGKIHKPIEAGERHFSHNELKNASDFAKFHRAACIYRQGTPATVKCKKQLIVK